MPFKKIQTMKTIQPKRYNKLQIKLLVELTVKFTRNQAQ